MSGRPIAAVAAAALVSSLAVVRSSSSAPCAIVGDCLGVGLADFGRECDVNARVGRSAAAIAAQRLPGRYRWGVISAGSNNPLDPHLREQLRETRSRLEAEKVIWILPTHPRAAAAVRAVAAERGDIVQPFAPGRDGVHPRSYQRLMRDVRARL